MKLEGYSNYEIYPETGQVWSYFTNRFVGKKGKCGYMMCTLTDDCGKYNVWLLHRLVWTAVNGKIPHDMEINHLDENRLNNSITNLSMVSHKENANWGTRNTRMLKNRTGKFSPKSVVAIENGVLKMYFSSTREAERNGYNSTTVSRYCKNTSCGTAYGYQWQYVDDYLADWWDKEMDKYMEMDKGA